MDLPRVENYPDGSLLLADEQISFKCDHLACWEDEIKPEVRSSETNPGFEARSWALDRDYSPDMYIELPSDQLPNVQRGCGGLLHSAMFIVQLGHVIECVLWNDVLS